MGRTVFIDGYNVIGRTAHLRSLQQHSLQHARDGLITMLAARYGPQAQQLVIVFDGDGPHETHEVRQRIAIIFTAAHETADDCIVRHAQTAHARGEAPVICTDDQAIRQALGGLTPQVSHQGAQVLGQALLRAPKERERLYKHRQHVLQEFARDAEPDDAPAAPRRGNARRAPKRPRQP